MLLFGNEAMMSKKETDLLQCVFIAVDTSHNEKESRTIQRVLIT